MRYTIVVKDDIKSAEIANYIKKNMPLEYSEDKPDYIISLGGDGTFLRAVHKYIDNIDNAIFFGINTGRLGFYTDYSVEEIDELIETIIQNNFNVNTHSLISYKTKNNEGYSLNEVTITNNMVVQVVDIFVDDEKFETCRGTGLCISTTNGSTAYNKSLGGPVVDPKLDAFILTEIAAINSNVNRTLSSPVVLSKNHLLSIKCYNSALFTADHYHVDVAPSEVIEIRFSNKKIKYVDRNQTSFIKRIQKAFL